MPSSRARRSKQAASDEKPPSQPIASGDDSGDAQPRRRSTRSRRTSSKKVNYADPHSDDEFEAEPQEQADEDVHSDDFEEQASRF